MSDFLKKRLNFGSDEEQAQKKFRKVSKTYTDIFKIKKDYIFNFLGNKQNLSSGLYRESLLREFLREVLPTGISIDSGFIYGFEEIDNSNQIDIIIWDSMKNSCIYRTENFVIVPPESVISIISVKSNLNNNELEDALINISSVIDLDVVYRDKNIILEKGKEYFPPITKYIISYSGPTNYKNVLETVSKYYHNKVNERKEILDYLNNLIGTIKTTPNQKDNATIYRIFPKCITSIEYDFNFIVLWGPNDCSINKNSKPLRPYIIPQKNKNTTSLEKFVYNLLSDVYLYIENNNLALLCAWGDFNSVAKVRCGDAYELIDEDGISLY
jgi:hypothetical protein